MQIVAYHVPGSLVNAEHILFMAPPADAADKSSQGCIIGYASHDVESDLWAGMLTSPAPAEFQDLADRDGLGFAIDGATKSDIFTVVSERWGGAEIVTPELPAATMN